MHLYLHLYLYPHLPVIPGKQGPVWLCGKRVGNGFNPFGASKAGRRISDYLHDHLPLAGGGPHKGPLSRQEVMQQGARGIHG